MSPVARRRFRPTSPFPPIVGDGKPRSVTDCESPLANARETRPATVLTVQATEAVTAFRSHARPIIDTDAETVAAPAHSHVAEGRVLRSASEHEQLAVLNAPASTARHFPSHAIGAKRAYQAATPREDAKRSNLTVIA